MITIRCDRCDRTLRVPDDKAGMKVQCPHCGDVNLVPVAIRAIDDRAEAMGLPPDAGPEREVMTVHPAMLRARPGLFFLILLAALGGVGGAVYFFAFAPPSQIAFGWACAGLAGAALIVLGVWKIKTLDAGLRITNKRTVERRGLLSKTTSEVLHENIRNFQITQTFWERLWGVGTVGISSAGQDEIEIVVRHIPRPYRVRDVIDAYRNMD